MLVLWKVTGNLEIEGFGLVVASSICLICLVSWFLGLRALGDIVLNGRGFRSIYTDKAREATLCLAAISAISICLAYLAITDILKDYAGYLLRLPNGEPIRSVLEYWALCEREWTAVFVAIITIALLQVGILAIQVKKKRVEKPIVPSSARWKDDIGFQQ